MGPDEPYAARKFRKIRVRNPLNLRNQFHRHFLIRENTNPEIESALKDPYMNSALQADVSSTRKAVVMHIPSSLREVFRKVHVRLVRELEKRFSGKDVIFIATRRIEASK